MGKEQDPKNTNIEPSEGEKQEEQSGTQKNSTPKIPEQSATEQIQKCSTPSQLPLLIVTGLSLIIACVALFYAVSGNNSGTLTLDSGLDGNSANFTDGSIADVANAVSPSVVSIITETRTTSFYYGQNDTSTAAGTGMIVSSDGYILTNKHVIDGASSISVILDDGTPYGGVKVVATDPLSDVAYLKIDGVSNLPTVTLGDSKTVSVGQQVIAIGNALGQYQNTVTSGIISGTGRSVTATDSSYSTTETLTDMIQTDAAINAGNSGGPLVNAAGQVIGINTATSSANDIGFAIPISSVKGMLAQLLTSGTAERSYVGVYYVNLTPSIAKQLNVSTTYGAYVYNSKGTTAVISGSPAEKAGLKDKDIIIAINGHQVGVSGSVSSLIGEYKPGDTVQFTIIRNGNQQDLKVTLGTYPTTTSQK